MKLSDTEILEKLRQLNNWELRNSKLHLEAKFADFNEAFGKMVQIALMAEKLDHHPEWRNVYNHLEIDLTTHDAGGITKKDFRLAEFIDQILNGKKS